MISSSPCREASERAPRVPAEASSCREEPHDKGHQVYVGGRREGGFEIPARGWRAIDPEDAWSLKRSETLP